MDTNEIALAAAAVTGARHVRAQRNGQDAVATWRGEHASVVVVCDGCGSSASSEVGAGLGARLFARALGELLDGGAAVDDAATWTAARERVRGALVELVTRLAGDALHDQLLFTIAAAAACGDAGAVWILGDGAYAFDGDVRTIGPFADNAPPYLGHDLLAWPPQAACFALAPRDWRSIVIATDGAAELDLAAIARDARFVTHPDALRRHLVVQARASERVEWDARRIARTPALLQDDCAIGILNRSAA